jgi:uncharacterized protein (TIRG00374 family)
MQRFSFRRLLIAFVFLLAFVFIFTRAAEVQKILDTIRRGDIRWLGLGILVHMIWMANVAASFNTIYRALGMRETWRHMMAIAAAANFVNIVAPTGVGVAGMAVLVADGNKRGLPSGRIATAAAAFLFVEQISLLGVIILGLTILFQLNQLGAAEILAASILAAIALVLGVLLYLGMRSSELLAKALAGIGTLVNRALKPFLRRDYIDLEHAQVIAAEINDGLLHMRKSPGTMALALILGFSSKALLIVTLMMMFLAFQVPLSFGTVVASFSIGYLFYIVSPTPSGIGFVESAMTLVMRSLRVPLESALLIALAYRGITFWLMLAYGAIAMRWVAQDEPAPVQVAPS